MTAHALARALLELPDDEALIFQQFNNSFVHIDEVKAQEIEDQSNGEPVNINAVLIS